MLEKSIDAGIVIARLSDGATNAITLETLKQLKSIVDEVNEDDALKGIVLTGEGRFLSSGFSLPMFLCFETPEDVLSFFEQEEQILLDYFSCKKPVVCAINGHCVAMGMILALASDYRIAADNPKAKLGMSEIKIGLGLSIAESAVVRFGLDSNRTFRDVMYFGEMVDVLRAKEMGMVDEIVDDASLIPRACELIRLWIDTPNRPFIQIKDGLRRHTAEQIAQDLLSRNWQDQMAQALLDEQVRGTLSFVQASLEKKPG